MTRTSAAVALACTLVFGVAVAALSQWPVSGGPADGTIRLSWRTEPLRVEACRQLTEEELANVPAHMRRTEECSGGFADYELALRIDDRTPRVDTLSPSGLRGDRPVYVLIDERVMPGSHRVSVVFTALVPPELATGNDHAVLSWEGEVQVGPREIGLITLDPTGTVFVRR